MPAAVPLIVAWAAETAAVEAGLVIAGGIGAAVIGGVAAGAAGLLMASLSKPPSLGAGLSQPGAGRTQQFRQPTPVHEVVVGRVKKSGPIMFVYSAPDDTGRQDGYFYMVHALAAHHCRAVSDVYIDSNLSTNSQYAGLVRFSKYLGETDQIADPDFVAETSGEWTDGHRLRGRCVLYSRLKGNAAAFPNGLPNLSAIVWGCDQITDPRTGHIGWTNNAIVIAYWWMTWGEGYDASSFDLDSLIAAANICDERVRVFSDSTTFTVDTTTNACTLAASSRSLDVGDGVRVSSSAALPAGLSASLTYYAHPFDDATILLALSVADACNGVGVDITDAGSGTLTLTYWDEARYKVNGSFTLDVAKSDVRDQLLSACAGFAVEVGGVWFLHAGAAATPVVTLTEDDLRDTMVTTPKKSMRDRVNGIRAVFVNPDNNWQPSDAPPLINPTYVEEDNGVELVQDMKFPFTLSARGAQRLMKIYLERNRLQRSIKFPAKLTAMRLRPLDGCFVSNARYGWDREQHQVMGWVLAEDGGVDLLLQNDSASVYAWDASEELFVSASQSLVLPDPSVIAAPSGIAVNTPTLAIFDSLTISWAEVKSLWLAGYDPEYRDAGTTDWTGYGRVGSGASLTISVSTALPQDIQIRAVTRNGAVSAFLQNMAPGLPTSVSATGAAHAINLAWTNASAAISVQIFVSTTNVIDSATLLAAVSGTSYAHTSLGASATRYYWLRSVNAAGNISSLTSVVSATTSP